MFLTTKFTGSNQINIVAKQLIHRYSTIGEAAPTAPRPRVWKKYVLRTGVAVLAATLAHDSLNEFQYFGGATRFLRSMKIAAQISFDYSWNLYGIDEKTEEYKKVCVIFVRKNQDIFLFQHLFNDFFFSWSKKSICVRQIVCWMDVWRMAVCTLKLVKAYQL